MSNAVWPSFAGEGYPGVRRMQTSTIVKTSASGREVRIPNYEHPRWQWELTFAYLSQVPSIADFQTFLGFIGARGGSYDSFLLWDETDCYAAAQFIGVGDGHTLAFQLQRTVGSLVEPIYDINGVVASYPALAPPARHIYLGGALQSSGYSIGTTGLVTFTSAPGSGVIVSADLGYFWRVRLDSDELEMSILGQDAGPETPGANASGIWACQKFVLQGVRA